MKTYNYIEKILPPPPQKKIYIYKPEILNPPKIHWHSNLEPQKYKNFNIINFNIIINFNF